VPTAWGGPDPVSFVDPADYELGSHFVAAHDITLTHVRIFGGTGSTFVGRTARVWTTAPAVLAVVTLPNTILAGWNTYQLPAPVQVLAGTEFWVSYSTVGAYGFINAGFAYPVNSIDNNVLTVSSAFNGTPTLFPGFGTDVPSGFFGVDCVYDVGLTLNSPPVAGVTVNVVSGLQVQAAVTIVDEVPGTCTKVVEWGDGTQTIGGLGPGTLTHTYAVAGTYAVLVTVTDASSATDSAAAPITVYELPPDGPPFVWKKTSARTIGTGLLNGVAAALVSTTCGRPKRVVYSVGADQPWDACDCGQLALNVNRRYTSRSFPTDASDSTRGDCENSIVVFDCSLSIVRCVPGPGRNGEPPTATALDAAFRCQEEDAQVVWNTAWCYFTQLRDITPRLIVDFIINDQPSLGPSGACGGSQLNFKFGLYVPCGCG
jgi:PKD repeat protein